VLLVTLAKATVYTEHFWLMYIRSSGRLNENIKKVNKGLENKIIELQQKIEDMVRFIMIIGRGGFVCAASISMWLFWDQDYFTSNFDYFYLYC